MFSLFLHKEDVLTFRTYVLNDCAYIIYAYIAVLLC